MKGTTIFGCGLAVLALATSGCAQKADPETLARGKAAFLKYCSSCHGPEGKGIPKTGKNITASDFIAKHSDQELLEYVKRGRPVNDPLNTTGIAMPPKGGNPALTDQEILDAIAFVRTLQV